MSRRLIAALAALCVAVFAFSACGDDEKSDGGSATTAEPAASKVEGKKVTFVGPVAAPVWLDAKKGFEDQAKADGMVPTWTAPAAVDIPGNVQAIESAITSGADGIATCALDPKAYGVALQHAKEKGIPVVLVDCDTADRSLRVAFVGTIGSTFGAGTARHALELDPTGGEVIVLQSGLDVQIQNDIFRGFEETISGQGNWRVVAREAEESNVQKAVAKLEALFGTHPNAKYVYCIEAFCPEAAATVIREKGLKGRVQVIGIDDQPATLQGVRDGIVVFSAAQPFLKMGRLAASALAESLSGGTPEDTTDTGVVVIDKSNVTTYKNDQ
ncbi:MAG TPA: substrate-binding domain-containing protein [Conexibacter sp.]|nr:substrate-binding domain-containing protein [Conexibacter sp.]